jgi:predicted amidophosphoribosyltransferase
VPSADLAVVPVPASPLRIRRRGFDPAELIAAALARELGLVLAPCLRRRHGPRQGGRPRAARLEAPPRVRAMAPVPRRALIVDDVLTTGATVGACAAALRSAGCAEVEAAVFARAWRA